MTPSIKIYKLIFSIAIFLSLIFYTSSIGYYFFQDDFFEINISKAHSFSSYLNFYKFRDDIIAYRPISLQNYFFFSQYIFGLNPVGFRLITFIFFLSSAYLITLVAKFITGSTKTALLTASFWLTSSIHFMSITWIAAAYNIIGTFFYLTTVLFFLKFLEEKKKLFYLFSLISFLITIGSFEFSATFPFIFAAYCRLLLKKKVFYTLRVLLPFFILTIVYLVLRSLLIKVPQITEYKLAFNADSAKALFWYILWSFNIPDELKKQVANNLIMLRMKFLIDYWQLVALTVLSALWVFIIGIFLPIYNNLKKRININWRLIFFCAAWFAFGISPVLLLPNHTFTMYLTLSSIGIYMGLSYLLVKNSKPILTFSVLFLFLLSSYTTLHFYKTNSWMIEAQKFSKSFAFGIKEAYPILPEHSVVLYVLESNQKRQALLFSHALRAIYDDPTLTIYYNSNELHERSEYNSNELHERSEYNKSELIKDVNNGMKAPIYIYTPE